MATRKQKHRKTNIKTPKNPKPKQTQKYNSVTFLSDRRASCKSILQDCIHIMYNKCENKN